MAISTDHVGRVYPATAAYEVTAERIAAFAAALGDDHPAYAGPDPVAPPTFGIVVAARAWEQLFADPELELTLARTMHAEQTFEAVRPLRAGDRITATLRITKVRVRGPVEMISLAVDLDTVAGEHVQTASSLIVHTRGADADQ